MDFAAFFAVLVFPPLVEGALTLVLALVLALVLVLELELLVRVLLVERFFFVTRASVSSSVSFFPFLFCPPKGDSAVDLARFFPL